MPTAAIVSFRLGGPDGVSVEAVKWQGALEHLGFRTYTVAGAGPVDRLLPGLAIGAEEPPSAAEVTGTLDDADLVLVENLCSLPLNPPAASAVARACRGRPAVLRHHDLPWQRPHLAHHPPPADDPAWRHVTINELSTRELGERGIAAVTVYNAFDTRPRPPGRREAMRTALGVHDGERLILQPTRALPRKNVQGGVAVAEALGAIYWLLGPAEDGFGPELARVLAGAGCALRYGAPPGGASPTVSTLDPTGRPPMVEMDDAYAACDAVVLPSTWEGFGNPAIESAIYGRPLCVGPYPVADELERFGFEWFHLGEEHRLAQWLDAPDPGLLERNRVVAEREFSLDRLPERLAGVLDGLVTGVGG